MLSRITIISALIIAASCNDGATSATTERRPVDSCLTAKIFENAKLVEDGIATGYSGELKNYVGEDTSKIDFIHYFDNGKIWKSVFYYEDGKPAEEYLYKCASLHGVQKKWYDNGVLAQLLPYRYGRMQGKVEEFDKNGRLRNTVIFKADSVVERKRYSETGEELK